MTIRKLDYEVYKGQKYHAEILSDRYLSIEPEGEGFDIRWVMSGEPLRMTVDDPLLRLWQMPDRGIPRPSNIYYQ